LSTVKNEHCFDKTVQLLNAINLGKYVKHSRPTFLGRQSCTPLFVAPFGRYIAPKLP